MVIVTTCVASQRLVSSTALSISMVSPLSERWWAMIRVMNPIRDDATNPMAPLNRRSRINPSSTAPQPMKMADE